MTTAPKPAEGAHGPVNVGSAPVGTTAYPIPAGAIFVAPGGSDRAAGTLSAPLKTVAMAISKAQNGGTIVLRAGTYHEDVTVPPEKSLTIQSYPQEAVWFDGSVPLTNFTRAGSLWKVSGWTAEFDSSPTFTRGAPQYTAPGWNSINPNYPMAAHPDQVWIDGVPQQQVGSRAAVRPGTFFVDYASNELYLGSDPSGHAVRASDLIQAIMVVSEGTTLRGFGVRRYANSIPDFGVISARRPGDRFENLVVEDSATIGIFVMATGAVLNHVTVTRSGMLGIGASKADDITVANSEVTQSNSEHFNQVPSAAGMKITKTRGIVVRDSKFSDNRAAGLWLDESTYDSTIVGNDIVGNDRHGLNLELSAKSLVVDNLIEGNGSDGLRITDTSSAVAWNNTVVGNRGNALSITQDVRRASDPNTPGHDPRRPIPDPTVTWLTGPVTVKNNIFSAGPSASSSVPEMVWVRDQSGTWPISRMGVTLDGNLYARPNGKPMYEFMWGSKRYATLKAFSGATGQDERSAAVDGRAILDSRYQASGTNVKLFPLPTDVAAATNRGAGSLHLGAWR